jgi:alpha-D-xyloside xylohydrolase
MFEEMLTCRLHRTHHLKRRYPEPISATFEVARGVTVVKVNRRQLGKAVATGFAASVLGTTTSQALMSDDVAWVPVMPGVWKASIGTPESISPVRSRLVAARVESLSKMPTVTQPPIIVPLGSVSPRGVKVELQLRANEQVYGFGLQFFSIAHRGKKRVVRVNADPKSDIGDSHAPVPFYVTNRGYGVLIDTARYATFYCGEARDKPDVPLVASDSGTVPTTTSGLYGKTLLESQQTKVLVDVPSCTGVDVYLFAGPTMLEAVRRYNLFSGGGACPPEWGLGFWYRAQSNATGKDVSKLMQEFRDRKIPCDVVGLEPGWQTHAYSCSFVWHKEEFPEPAAFVREMQARNVHVNLWEHAFIHPSSPMFPDMVKLSGDKGVWGGLVPDFQDPQARKVFGDYHSDAFLDLGVDGFKLDECDNSDYTSGWSFPELSRFPSGVDGEQMHSLFGLRYQHAIWAQFQQRNRSTYGLVRSSGALAAPYPFALYSDLYDHRQFVRALVNSGFSGLLWCPEVRDAPNGEEDLIRRLQTVVLSPLAMINGWYIANPPWKQMDRKKNNAGELMVGWEKLEDRCRQIIGLRMQMVPYLRSAFGRYSEDGTPPFRALALDWPDIPGIANLDDAWMVGDRILVAPLFAGEPGRSLTLPPGDWHNFWTGELAHGGTTLRFAASEPNIPLFIKTGSVLPIAAITNSTADVASRELHVRIFGGGHLPFELTSEDGLSLRLTWDAAARKGYVQQSGPKQYQIKKWESA